MVGHVAPERTFAISNKDLNDAHVGVCSVVYSFGP
jgi:hypothetical protein